MTGHRRWLAPAAVLVAWLITRAAMVAAVHWSGYPSPGAVTSDTRLYAAWASLLRTGHFPASDASWQYPPGAAGVLLVPSFAGGAYRSAFVALMLAVDLGVVLALLRRAHRGDRRTAAWTWVGGIAAVGPVALYRFDLVPTALAVAGLLVTSPYAAGALLGLGGLVKLWPAVLVGSVRERGAPVAGWTAPLRALSAAVVVPAAALAGLALSGRLGEALAFTRHTRDRGLQIESVAATPYLLVHAFAPDAGGLRIVRRYGAYEVVGAYVWLGVAITTVATLGGLAVYAVLARRRGHRPEDRAGLALAAVLMLLVTSKVLSPQYLVWAVGVGAVTQLGPGRRYGGAVVLTVVAAALGQAVFPGTYLSLLHARPAAVLLLFGRNAVLLTALVLAVLPAVTRRDDRRTPDATLTSPTHTFGADASLEVPRRTT